MQNDLLKECGECQCEETVKESLCPVCLSQRVLKGKWKIVIIFLLKENCLRFSQIKKSIPKVTQSYLSKQLKELENANLINRRSFNEVPPRVEYSLTEQGKALSSVIGGIGTWGRNYGEMILQNQSEKILKI